MNTMIERQKLSDQDAKKLESQIGYLAVRLTDGTAGAQIVGSRETDFESIREIAASAVLQSPGCRVAIMRCVSVMEAKS